MFSIFPSGLWNFLDELLDCYFMGLQPATLGRRQRVITDIDHEEEDGSVAMRDEWNAGFMRPR